MATLRRASDAPSESTLAYYLSLEHGSETDRVPTRWRSSPLLQPCTLYGLSSFNYSYIGVLLLALIGLRPERSLYAAERVEALLWIWQGFISFKCDAVDLGAAAASLTSCAHVPPSPLPRRPSCTGAVPTGVRSWSHPVDRISATLFTLQQLVKYTFVSCSGTMGVSLYVALFLCLGAGVYCFRRSCHACRELRLEDYRRWSVAHG
jgi:hypothetical protein